MQIGLRPSRYLKKTAEEHISGKIDINEAKHRIDKYYKVRSNRKDVEKRTEEADKSAVRIAEVLGESSFTFSPVELNNIHRRIFEGVFDSAGEFRNYDISKREWVLNGDTVLYSSCLDINNNLEYDFEQEKNFSYEGLSLKEAIKHIARFIANIWQIHPFGEGNTRTIAVFLIKDLRTFGFNIDDEIFAENAGYFRNAFVRANYKNFSKNVLEDTYYLELFLENMITRSNHELKNRYTHIDYKSEKKLTDSNKYSIEEQAIINLISSNSKITQEEIAQSMNKSVRTIKNYMNKMQEKGIIKRENSKKNGEWNVLKKTN